MISTTITGILIACTFIAVILITTSTHILTAMLSLGDRDGHLGDLRRPGVGASGCKQEVCWASTWWP